MVTGTPTVNSFDPRTLAPLATPYTLTPENGFPGPPCRRREFCHSADIPSLSLLKRLLKGEGGTAK